MLAEQRRKRILELIEAKNSISVAELGQIFGVSEMTIRRDLRSLDREGFLKRVHGGAIADRGRSYEPPFLIRAPESAGEKEAIGRKAASLVKDGDSVALDVGSTTLQVAKALVGVQNLTIITSSLRIAAVLSSAPGIRLIVTGGIVREGEMSLVGHLAQRAYQDFRVDKAFIGVGGLDLANGLTEYNLEDALVKREIVNHAARVIVVADSSKLGRTCFASVAPLSRVHTLVTDSHGPAELMAKLVQKGVEVIQA